MTSNENSFLNVGPTDMQEKTLIPIIQESHYNF